MTSMPFIQRITDHIQRAEAMAAARNVSHLSRVQRLVRGLLLRALAVYRAEGRFPNNRDFAEPTPYFIDAEGTRCAMAHLLELGGEHALVQTIARERNNAYVRELADEPRLLAWLAAAGLTVEEAAAIQPSYCQLMSDCFCAASFSSERYPVPAKGVLEAVIQANGMARVEQTYGDALGIAVGSDVGLYDQLGAGARVLIPVDRIANQYFAITIQEDHTMRCDGNTQAPSLTVDQFQRAVTATSCSDQMATYDAAWNQTIGCRGGDDPPFQDGGGCAASHADAASVGILLALVGVLVRRN